MSDIVQTIKGKVLIDASFYPHIMDQILRNALPLVPRKLRQVCRYWRALVDVQEAHHLVLDMGLPPVAPEWPDAEDTAALDTIAEDADAEATDASIDVGTEVANAQPTEVENVNSAPPLPVRRAASENVTYAWQFSAKRLPLVFMHRSLAGEEHKALPWVDVRRHARALDIHSSAQWVRDAVPLDDFNLHTVRLHKGAGWESINLLPHAYRVVFADGPYARNLAAIPDSVQTCTCERTHTRKIVLNVRTSVLDHVDDRVPPTIPAGLRELVIVFHGWPIIPR